MTVGLQAKDNLDNFMFSLASPATLFSEREGSIGPLLPHLATLSANCHSVFHQTTETLEKQNSATSQNPKFLNVQATNKLLLLAEALY